MAWTKYQLFLAGMMLITGAINTLSTKWADTSTAPCPDLEYKSSLYNTDRPFDHPFVQSVGMFLGELSCLIFFKLVFLIHKHRTSRSQPTSAGLNALVDGSQQFPPIVFWPAALCDMTGTTMMYIGLNMTSASSFQMLRGAVIVFTALLSVAFLRREIKTYMWIGVGFVVVGLTIVGLADFVGTKGDPNVDQNRVITGDLIIVMAQIVTSIQMVYEEKYVSSYNIAPLQAVGWEGMFGFCTLSVLLVPMYFINVGTSGILSSDPVGKLENVLDAFCQLGNNAIILIAQLGNIISIAFFNFSGISVTREISATTRMVLDSMRTVIIWIVSVGVGWQKFNAIQIPGFLLLGLGTAIYNGLLNNLARKCYERVSGNRSSAGEREHLIQNDD